MGLLAFVETRLLILNADPVFQDRALALFDTFAEVEVRVVRTLSEAISSLLAENFDGFLVEGEPPIALEQATHVRQHFPSLQIVCLISGAADSDFERSAGQQKIGRIQSERSEGYLRKRLSEFIRSLEIRDGAPSEGVDPCHSLIGNLNLFSAAEILQMSCLSQRSGRFTFKSARGNSEIYLQLGAVRHAIFGTLEGEAAVAEIFRWRQGRFYFEEGIISQVQTVDRPWAHLLIDNLQKLDETLELVSG
ncbi:MAG: two-component system, chemotaxis family, protein-glutamate methylesterase/glutaminase [Verrucomicrobiota bacterium]